MTNVFSDEDEDDRWNRPRVDQENDGEWNWEGRSGGFTDRGVVDLALDRAAMYPTMTPTRIERRR